ncbi:helix-turn-helix domain-containing protein [Fusibacter sp. A2]|nr:helix-turn-helix domain-containing protein [Fusibacter sp. A2]
MTYESIRIGQPLATLRKRKGMSQDEVANYLKVTRQAISKWERNEALPDLQNMKMLSDLLEFSVDDLINGLILADAELVEGVATLTFIERVRESFGRSAETSNWLAEVLGATIGLVSVPIFIILLYMKVSFLLSVLVFFLVPPAYYVGKCIPVITDYLRTTDHIEGNEEW